MQQDTLKRSKTTCPTFSLVPPPPLFRPSNESRQTRACLQTPRINPLNRDRRVETTWKYIKVKVDWKQRTGVCSTPCCLAGRTKHCIKLTKYFLLGDRLDEKCRPGYAKEKRNVVRCHGKIGNRSPVSLMRNMPLSFVLLISRAIVSSFVKSALSLSYDAHVVEGQA